MKHYGRPPVLKSIAIAMVRNEQDIIEPFVRHHAALVDLLVILDNLSTDATLTILNELTYELDNVTIAHNPSRAYTQSETMTRVFHSVQSVGFSDFVLFLDADEFLGVSSREELESHLAAIPPGCAGLMHWQTWIPDPEMVQDSSLELFERFRLRRKQEKSSFSKIVLRPAGQLMSGVEIHQGNHSASWMNGTEVANVSLFDLPLRHFPVRSADQLVSKGVIGWRANLARPGFQETSGQAIQQRRIYDLWQQGKPVDKDNLAQEAMIYAEFPPSSSIKNDAMLDEHGIKVQRRYSNGSFESANDLIAASEQKDIVKCYEVRKPAFAGVDRPHIPGAFDALWHWDHIFLDEPICRAVWDKLRPKSVLDVGCGNGLFLDVMRHLGTGRIMGIDGNPREATVLNENAFIQMDLHDCFDLGEHFDLVVCLEVAEHLRREGAAQLFNTISQHSQKNILFSMGEPGQPGHGHIGCRPMKEVLEMWAERGWYPQLAPTMGFRSVATMSWFKRNLILLGKEPEKGAYSALVEIAARPFVWYNQRPGHRRVAFREALLPEGVGYAVGPSV